MAGADTAAAPVREALLATKLRVPRPRPGWVARARLTERLRGVTGRELVLVCGPAGFGKSSLVADWVRKHPMAAWLSLDEGDNDPVRFWRHVAAALDQVRPGLAARVEAQLGAGPAALDAAVSALVNELAEAADEVVLVVDDFHVVETPEVHRTVRFLLDHLPPALRLVLATRADPPLPLARMRARGQLTELRAADLRFTAEEAAALLRGAVGRTCRTPSSPRWVSASRGGRPGCSWPRCRCAGTRTSPASSRSSRAATATSWTTSPRRCWTGNRRCSRGSCWRRRSWSACRVRCATR